MESVKQMMTTVLLSKGLVSLFSLGILSDLSYSNLRCYRSVSKLQTPWCYFLLTIAGITLLILLLFSTQNILGAIIDADSDYSDTLLTGLYNNSIRSVVGVDVNVRYPNGSLYPWSAGSGFIYDNKGHIVTNYHVIEADPAGTTEISIKFIDGNRYPVTIVGVDRFSDLAVLKIDDPSILIEEHASALPLGSSPSIVGQHVVAIGNPIIYAGTMTQGIISQLNRTVSYGDYYQVGMVQFDALIDHGSSGGPLLNMKGEVIGVNSLGVSLFSFAIPLSTVERVVPSLIADGTYIHPWLGIGGLSVDPVLANDLGINEAKGVIVTSVAPGSPAEAAGIRAGTNYMYDIGDIESALDHPINSDADIILGIDNKDVRELDDIVNYVDTKKVGDTIVIRGIRGGNEGSVTATLTARPQ
jgi:S1-C subfamily serine protease